ncbi:MAG: lytic transglycosylase domain-containing protein [Bdellovibrio sp.]|nr:lytic transglycosylase domain-containing protein [Bdellovibrio sp.]
MAGFISGQDFSSNDEEKHIYTVMPRLTFKVEGGLEKNLKFWTNIYTQYYTYQGMIHDAKYIDLVYEILDFKIIDKKSEKAIREAKKRIKSLLLSVHKKQNQVEKMTEEEKKIYQLFGNIQEPNKFLKAMHRKRLRFQLGQKDRFVEGLYNSGKYLIFMEEIFKKEGLPIELTRLPFVESSFNLKARSKIGASGIWQFMKSTGKLYLKINDWVDERNDPIRATEAAAKLLKLNYESLGNWPLAVTAYNHGRKGLMRAVRKVGSQDLDEIVTEYRSSRFGFASGNFFTELLAAIEVEKNSDSYFPQLKRARPLSFYEVDIPDPVYLDEILPFLGINLEQVTELNPALSSKIFSGKKLFSGGYFLRLPLNEGQTAQEALDSFKVHYAQIPLSLKQRRQSKAKYDRKFTSEKKR